MTAEYLYAESGERGRRLRRRLTIFCGVWFVLLVASSAQYLPIGTRPWGEAEARVLAGRAPEFALCLGVLLWARWGRGNARSLATAAVAVVVAGEEGLGEGFGGGWPGR